MQKKYNYTALELSQPVHAEVLLPWWQEDNATVILHI